MEKKYVEWDDIFNADYTDHRLRQMVTINHALNIHESDTHKEMELYDAE